MLLNTSWSSRLYCATAKFQKDLKWAMSNSHYIIDWLAAMELFDVWKVISVATNFMWLMKIQDIKKFHEEFN